MGEVAMLFLPTLFMGVQEAAWLVTAMLGDLMIQ
jgi:hypothetical protein